MNNTALITGASSGIGRELAKEFARHGHDLILVARSEEHLRELSEDISRQHPGLQVMTIARDLENEQEVTDIYEELERAGEQPEILVNNAGHGDRGLFHELSIESHLSVLRLNVEALLRLTRLFLPAMVRRGSGRILNTASVASFQPGPMLATYHASKAFVLSLSIALREELKDTGVTVTALAPGPTDTNFFPRAHMEDTRVYQNDSMLMKPEELTEGTYKALMNGDDIYIPGNMNKLMTVMRRVMPKPLQAMFQEQFYKESKK